MINDIETITLPTSPEDDSLSEEVDVTDDINNSADSTPGKNLYHFSNLREIHLIYFREHY